MSDRLSLSLNQATGITALEKRLFYFACRHHILERLQGAAWQALSVRTHSPNNEYFKEFQEKWDSTSDKDDFIYLDVK